jgi:hypothetical protein
MGKKKSRQFTPAMMLHPRMKRLFAADAFPHQEDAAIGGDLEGLARGVSSKRFVKTLLHAYEAAPEAAQSRLDDILPRWLAQSGHLNTLNDLTSARLLDPDLRPRALAWLEAAGVDTADIEGQLSLFWKAYYRDDEALLLGEKSQAYVAVFWYADLEKKRARSLTCLLDYNPPWDGSVKDVIVAPPRSAKRLLREFLDNWREAGLEPDTVSPERAKTVILTALTCNREAEIRLPRDAISARDLIERYILHLPDGPDTPAFTMEDFDFLARHGQPTEEIRYFEHTVGRRVRLDDGEEVVVIGTDKEDEDW